MRKKPPKKSHKRCKNKYKKPVKLVKMHDFSSLGVQIQDFAQTQQNFPQLHDCMTATFKNSVCQVSCVTWHATYDTIFTQSLF